MSKDRQAILEVLISTIGDEGIKRIASHCHPAVEGVRYVVSWQNDNDSPQIPSDLLRDDFRISIIKGKGLSENRNHSIEISSAPFLLFSDDDVDYSGKNLTDLLHTLKNNPDTGVFCFRFESGKEIKRYPDTTFELRNPPEGYYFSSIEIAVRRDKIYSSGIRFNTDFGLGARFIAGEEELFVHEALKKGIKGRYFPITICSHNGRTTGSRMTIRFIESKGAVFKRIRPCTWPLRMFVHAWRNCRERSPLSFSKYVSAWIRGASSMHKPQ